MANSIRVSEKYGVNPSLGICWICGEDNGEIILPGRLKGDVQAPHRAVWDKEPCSQCKDWMSKGIIMIRVRDGEDGENPYRTGALVVVKEEAVRRFTHPQGLLDRVLRHRIAFVPDSAWEKLGLSREMP